MARVTLSQAGEDVFVGGSDVEVFGTSAGGEVITVITGNIRFDATFNRGGDTIVLPGLATSYSAYRIGADVVFTRNDGAVTIRVPFGTAGLEVQFDGGDSRTLLFDTSINQTTLEGQVIGTSSTSPTTLVAAGSTPPPTYDVVGANATTTEGDSGTKLLTFTITLDSAVSGSPLTLNYSTANGTATAGSDYVAASGTVTIPVGQQSGTVSIVINGDTIAESNETFTLNLTGGSLRNGPETLTGTITNDDQQSNFTLGLDTLQGTAANNTFTAVNGALGGGDSVTDGSTVDTDTVVLAVDQSTGVRNFSGFTLTNVEVVTVTNTSLAPVILDMSNATGVTRVMAVNSSAGVTFDQLTGNSVFVVSNTNAATADFQAFYQSSVTAGANTIVGLSITGSTVNQILLGTAAVGISGIETVNLGLSGVSSVGTLATQLTTLNISGPGEITINNPLSTSVRTINASGATQVTLDFSGNDGAGTGVTFTGSNGNDVVRAGQAADNISTGAGNDIVNDEGGDDTINTGAGSDSITLSGAGVVNVDAGADNDTINIASFGGDDIIQGGTGTDTLNVANAAINAFIRVSGVEAINFTNSGGAILTSIGVTDANAPTAGNSLSINASTYAAGTTFYYNAVGVSTFTSNLTLGAGDDQLLLTNGVADVAITGAGNDLVQLGGGDTVSLGAGFDIAIVSDGNNIVNGGDDGDLLQLYGSGNSQLNGENGNDLIEIFNSANFDAGDIITGGAGTDTIALTTGTYADAQFTNVTGVEVLSTRDGAVNVTIGAEAQDGGNGIRTVNLSGAASNTLNAAAYTFGLTITSAGGNDAITAGSGNDTFNGGSGAETVRGQSGDDVLNGGAGNDFLYGDIIFSDAGSLAFYNGFGGGADTINGGLGDDVIVGGLGKDTLTGGDGADTFRYYSVEDSRISNGGAVDARDVVTDFVAGTDKIDLTQLAAAVGQTIHFAGDYATFAEAQAAVAASGGDNFLDVVFARNANGQSVLFVDVDNNAVLDNNDLQIVLTNVTGSLTATDVNNPHLVTGPDMAGVGTSGFEQGAMAVMDQSYPAFRLTGLYDSQHIA